MFIKRFNVVWLSAFVSACCLLIILLIPNAFATGDVLDTALKEKNSEKIQKFLSEKKKEDREKTFLDLTTNTLTYVTARSLSGKSGDWVAFVDIYQEYEHGKEQKKFVLQGANIQYGLEGLPESAESSTLIIGKHKQKIDAEKRSSFSFETIPLMKLSASALKDICRVTISSGKESASISLSENFPSKEICDFDKALSAMSEPFYEYLHKESLSTYTFHKSFMRLKSYIMDLEKMQSGYTWELVLIKDEKLPSESIIVRFDCETEKVSIVSRETRNHFN